MRTLGDAQNQRRAPLRRHQFTRVVFRLEHQRVRALQLSAHLHHELPERALFVRLIVEIFCQLWNDFSICVALKHVPLPRQGLSQRLMIRDDTVVHDQKGITTVARVRVRVFRRRRTVRRPSRVRGAAVRLKHQVWVQILFILLHQRLEVGDLPSLTKHLRLRVRHLAPIVDRQSRRVVPAILQSPQTREKFLDDLRLPLRAVVVAVREDATHDARTRTARRWCFRVRVTVLARTCAERTSATASSVDRPRSL